MQKAIATTLLFLPQVVQQHRFMRPLAVLEGRERVQDRNPEWVRQSSSRPKKLRRRCCTGQIKVHILYACAYSGTRKHVSPQ
ncbi:hypothetical protein B0J12DRAFT_656487 [Macrophomina phaseolina]|uniref:Secreted protein n=1 Tax=Macrophomina phaseolina TaxID=35725 RepID=A0ABQ8GHR8_9PEZI|nr:hypothetical protein B0J12DRAFT_656487 [Macrophomina phaseolina]